MDGAEKICAEINQLMEERTRLINAIEDLDDPLENVLEITVMLMATMARNQERIELFSCDNPKSKSESDWAFSY